MATQLRKWALIAETRGAVTEGNSQERTAEVGTGNTTAPGRRNHLAEGCAGTHDDSSNETGKSSGGEASDLDLQLFGSSPRSLVYSREASASISALSGQVEEYVYLVLRIRTFAGYAPYNNLHSVHADIGRATACVRKLFREAYAENYYPGDPLTAQLSNEQFNGRGYYWGNGAARSEIVAISKTALAKSSSHEPWFDSEVDQDDGFAFVVIVQSFATGMVGMSCQIHGVWKYREEANEEAEEHFSKLAGQVTGSDWEDGLYRGEKVFENLPGGFSMTTMRELLYYQVSVRMVCIEGGQAYDVVEDDGEDLVADYERAENNEEEADMDDEQDNRGEDDSGFTEKGHKEQAMVGDGEEIITIDDNDDQSEGHEDSPMIDHWE